MRRSGLRTFAVGFAILASAHFVLAADAEKDKPFVPGSNSSLPWKALDFDKSREAGKPILLYIYDTMKGNSCAMEFECSILSNNSIVAAFADFVPVKIPTSDRRWPANLVKTGSKGAALIVMTCDGRTVASFRHDKMPKRMVAGVAYPELKVAAQEALQQNAQALVQIRKVREDTPVDVQGLLSNGNAKKAGAKKTEEAKQKDQAKRKTIDEAE